jgi:hypothetical protein
MPPHPPSILWDGFMLTDERTVLYRNRQSGSLGGRLQYIAMTST